MAHFTLDVVARLPLHPARRLAKRPKPHAVCVDDDDASWRPLAWRFVEFRAVGFCARPAAHRPSFREGNWSRQAIFLSIRPGGRRSLVADHSIFRVLYLADFPSGRHRRPRPVYEDLPRLGWPL